MLTFQTTGVTITDYVIGNGVEPKPGAKVKLFLGCLLVLIASANEC